MSEESLPIHATDLDDAVGKEFYLMVPGDSTKDRIAGYAKNRGCLSQVARAPFTLLRRLLGRKRLNFEDYDGSVMEVTAKEQYSIEGYLWGEATGIAFDDGTRFGRLIPEDEVFRSFLFTPTSTSRLESGAYVMKGNVRECELGGEPGRALTDQVTVYFDDAPTRKTFGGIATL